MVRQNPTPTPVALKFTNAIIAATGFPNVLDYNDPNTPIGVSSQLQYTQMGSNGELRVSSATAFLNSDIVDSKGHGVNGRSLEVKFKSTAMRTIWEGSKAIGVEYWHHGKIKKAYATRGVIVCSGLKSSPFLMHSGVGPRQILEPLGIPVVYDNPNVGEGLADQPHVVIAFTSNPADTPIVSNPCPGGIPSSITLSEWDSSWMFHLPDLDDGSFQEQFVNTVFCDNFEFPGNSLFAQISWLPEPLGDPTVRKVRIATSNPIPGLTIALVDLVQPLSRGRVTINNFNPFSSPVIDVGEFSDEEDLDLFVQAFQTYIKDINTELQAQDPLYGLIFPDPAILDDAEQLRDFIKEEVGPNQHWQCHCRMAPLNEGGVVDSLGRVHGVQNLYVADNSIVPVNMDGSPMASAYLIAANIARLLLQ